MRRAAVVALLVALAAGGCASSATRARGSADVLRLGLFPNLTHAPAYVGIGAGIFEDVLAPTQVRVSVFNSGFDAGTALLSGTLDAAYIGPGPTAELHQRSGNVAVVAGAVSGGASLVVRTGAGIDGPQDLRGKRVAVPALANTQDVALRTWLHERGLAARDEGGDVTVIPVQNSELLQLFRTGQLDAAWEPEPWPSLLTAQGLARQLVDEAALWPGGLFVTSNLLVSTRYMDSHPEVIARLVRANVLAIRLIQDEPDRARALVGRELHRIGAIRLPAAALDQAWKGLTFTWDPLPETLQAIAGDAHELGYLDQDPSTILRVYRLDDLNAVLEEMGLPPVSVPT